MIRIHWFRRDLRRHDNPALGPDAGAGDEALLPVFVLDPRERIGRAAQWWLHNSLRALRENLGGLTILAGEPETLLPMLARKTGARAVTWTRVDEPAARQCARQVMAALTAEGVAAREYPSNLLHEPGRMLTAAGSGFKVFTPFWNALRRQEIAPSQPAAPLRIHAEEGAPLESLHLLPAQPNWAQGWQAVWQPGEAGALARLDRFMDEGLAGYAAKRDYPALPHVSRLSPHLHWGELSVRLLWRRIANAAAAHRHDDIEKYLSEVAWRDFAYHLLHHFPTLAEENWNRAFDAYPWREDEAAFAAWTKGQTGYPLVDAGMRELWATGWMHNRARMVAASFLTKHLRISWKKGAAWFADTLVDADLAVNAASWQWVAGTGADAAPYFRIFNPATQAEKFDPGETYIRRWCPERFRPGARMGRDYPAPIVDHKTARAAALDSYRHVRTAPSHYK